MLIKVSRYTVCLVCMCTFVKLTVSLTHITFSLHSFIDFHMDYKQYVLVSNDTIIIIFNLLIVNFDRFRKGAQLSECVRLS